MTLYYYIQLSNQFKLIVLYQLTFHGNDFCIYPSVSIASVRVILIQLHLIEQGTSGSIKLDPFAANLILTYHAALKVRSWSFGSAQSIERFKISFLVLLNTSEAVDLVKNQAQKNDQVQISHLYGLMVGIELFSTKTGICAT